MSLILRPNATSSQAAGRPSIVTALRSEQAQQKLPSFDEVLFRSLTPGLKITGKIAAKAATATPARRPAVANQTDPADPLNAIAMTLVAPDRGVKPAAAQHALDGRENDQATLVDAASPQAGPETPAPDSAALASRTLGPGLPAAPAVTSLNPGLENTVSMAAGVPQSTLPLSALPLSTLPQSTRGASDGSLAAPELKPAQITGAAPQTALKAEPRLLPGKHADVDQPALPVQPAARSDQPALASAAAASAAQAVVPNTGTPDLSSRGDERSANSAYPMVGISAAASAAVASPSANGSASVAASAAPTARKAERRLLPDSPIDAGQSTQQAVPGAVSKQPALAPAPGTLTAQAIRPDSGTPDLSSKGVDRSANNAYPMVDLSAGLTAAVASPYPGPNPDNSAAVAGGLPLPDLSASTRPPTDGSVVAPEPMPALIAAAAPLTALKPEPRLPAGSRMDAEQPTLPAAPAAVGDQPARAPDPPATLSVQASTPDKHTAGADSFSASANLLVNPLPAAAPGAPGTAASSSASSVGNSALLSPEVGSKEWGQALGQQVFQLGKAGHQVTELQLNPPGLGPLKVTLHLNDHQMQVTFVSAHATVRAAVEAAVPQLRASLADNGISLGNTSVSSESQAQTAFAQNQNTAPRHQAYRSNSQPQTLARSARPLGAADRQSDGLSVDTYA